MASLASLAVSQGRPRNPNTETPPNCCNYNRQQGRWRHSTAHEALRMGDMPVAGSDRTSEFVALFAAHDRGIYKHILTLLVDPATTQEVFQETSVTLWQKFDEFQPGSSF